MDSIFWSMTSLSLGWWKLTSALHSVLLHLWIEKLSILCWQMSLISLAYSITIKSIHKSKKKSKNREYSIMEIKIKNTILGTLIIYKIYPIILALKSLVLKTGTSYSKMNNSWVEWVTFKEFFLQNQM
jgi:hypothetical protein